MKTRRYFIVLPDGKVQGSVQLRPDQIPVLNAQLEQGAKLFRFLPAFCFHKMEQLARKATQP